MTRNQTSSSSKPKLGRRTYLIDRGFQLKYTVLLVLCGASICILFGTLAYLAEVDVQRSLMEELGRARPRSADSTLVARLIRESTTTLLVLTVGVTVLMSLALGLLGILITHRVAGPVYVMTNYVTALSEGRYPLFRPLRRNDELKAFFDRFRSAIDSLRKIEEQDNEAIGKAIDQLRASDAGPLAQQALDALAAVYERKRNATHWPGSKLPTPPPVAQEGSASAPHPEDGPEITE